MKPAHRPHSAARRPEPDIHRLRWQRARLRRQRARPDRGWGWWQQPAPPAYPLARRPAEFRAFVAYHDALMDKETAGLSKADREMIVVATSAANDCTYCVVAHGAILRIRAKDPLLADQVGDAVVEAIKGEGAAASAAKRPTAHSA